MLVKFSCGCVGLQPHAGEEAEAIVCSPCDAEESGSSWSRRDMRDSTWVRLRREEENRFLQRFNREASAGQALRAIQDALGICRDPRGATP